MYGSPVISTEYRACLRKICYETWEEAEVAARMLIADVQAGKARRYKGGYHMAYRCDFCKGWHVGVSSFYVTARAMLKAGWKGAIPAYRKSPTRVRPE